MRILIITRGVDRSEAHLYAGLRERGIDVALYAAAEAERTLPEQLGLKCGTFVAKHRLDLSAVAEVRRILTDGEFGAVYAPDNTALAVALRAARAMGIPVVGYRGTLGHLSRFNPADRLTYLNPHIARIVCVSEAVRAYLLGLGVASERLVTIYKGHAPDWYKQERPYAIRKEFNIPEKAFLVGFAGRMRAVKGVDILLRALLELPADAGMHLLLVGEVQDRRVLRLASDFRIRERVHLAGFRADAWRLTGMCDVFVMPSLKREGLPRAVIEAMAQGVPAIVTDVGGMPELVRHEKDGLVVPPGDTAALAAALKRMEQAPAERAAAGVLARRRIAETFHINNTIDQYQRLFSEI